MICPMMKGSSTAPPCKRDGGGKGSACAWWDGNQNQCVVQSISGALEGIERVLAAVFEFEQLKKILDAAQTPTVLEKLKDLSHLWYRDSNEEPEDLDAPGADHASDIPLEDGHEHPTDEEAELDGEE